MTQTNSTIWKALRGHSETIARVITLALLAAAHGRSQSVWETAVDNIQRSFTGPIARGLSLVAIVIGGLNMAFGEGGSKRAFAGILFGIGMAVGAVSFLEVVWAGK